MNIKKILALVSILITTITHASDDIEYKKFFERYVELGTNFDNTVSNLYSDEAEIILIRTMLEGVKQTLNVQGMKWKEMIVDAMEVAKRLSDKSEFTNTKIVVDDNKAKITAHRYSTIKCFSDKNYYMIIEKNSKGELRIIEEQFSSISQTSCKNPAKNYLSLVLQATVNMINRQLPKMVDNDTRFEKASSEGDTLIYNYVLINYLSTEIEASVLGEYLRPMLISQTCSVLNLQPIIDQDGKISFRYNGKDLKQILEINVDKSSCDQL